MKRTLILTLMACLILTCCVGCSDTEQPKDMETTLVAMTSSSIETECDFVNIAPEFEAWYSERYGDTAVNQPEDQIQINFNGQEYSLQHQYTYGGYNLGTKTLSFYTTQAGEVIIDAKDGSVDSFIRIERNDPDITKYSDEVFEQCKTLAENIARDYVDLEYFTLVSEKRESGPYLQYVQYVEGVKTENIISLEFDVSGKFKRFSNQVSEGYNKVSITKTNNSASGESIANKLASDEAKQTAVNKMTAVFADFDVCKYDIIGEKMYVMPDGKLVNSYTFKVETKGNDPIKDETGDPVGLTDHSIICVAVLGQ